MESFSPVHSMPLSPSDCLWPHPNHCLIIQTEQLLSRLLCFLFHCNPIAYVYSLLLSGVKNKQSLLFLLKLHGLPRAKRAESTPHSQQLEELDSSLIWPTFLLQIPRDNGWCLLLYIIIHSIFRDPKICLRIIVIKSLKTVISSLRNDLELFKILPYQSSLYFYN